MEENDLYIVYCTTSVIYHNYFNTLSSSLYMYSNLYVSDIDSTFPDVVMSQITAHRLASYV